MKQILNSSPLDKNGLLFADEFFCAFSWMKSFAFCLRFHWSLFLGASWQYPSIGSDKGLAPNRWQPIIWTYAGGGVSKAHKSADHNNALCIYILYWKLHERISVINPLSNSKLCAYSIVIYTALLIIKNWPVMRHILSLITYHNHIWYNNNGPNWHLFYVGGDLMMRKGMLPIIMLPDGDLRIVLHLVPFWILTI